MDYAEIINRLDRAKVFLAECTYLLPGAHEKIWRYYDMFFVVAVVLCTTLPTKSKITRNVKLLHRQNTYDLIGRVQYYAILNFHP